MILPLKRNIRDKIFEVCKSFLRGVLEGLKISRLKFSRSNKNPRNPRKFSPSKILGYTVLTTTAVIVHIIIIIVLSYCIMVTRCCITVIKYISAGNSGEAELLKLCIVVILELMFNRSLKHDWLFLIN